MKGPFPTTLLLFKVRSEADERLLLNHGVEFNNKVRPIRRFLNPAQVRCTNCQKIGHLAKGCKLPKKCVRCASPSCNTGNCSKKTRKCSNCGQSHASSYKNCPALKEHKTRLFLKAKDKTYAEVVNSTKQQVVQVVHQQ